MNKVEPTGRLQLVLVIGFIVFSLVFSSLMESSYEPPSGGSGEDRELFVETKRVEPTTHRIRFDTTGIIEAKNKIRTVAEVSGRVVKVHESFFAGGTFKKGEVLFEIEPRDFKLEVQRQQAEVARARTALNLESAESNAALAEWRQLHGQKPAPDLVARKPQLAEARANLQSAQALLENAKLDLERTKFTLPFDGRVIESDIAEGQYVMAGQAYGEVFDRTKLEIVSSLQDKQLNWLLNAKAPEITVKANYLGKQVEYQAELKRSVAALDTNTRFASVRFGFKDEAPDMLPGIFAELEVLGPEAENVMVLPSSALQTDSSVWFVEDGALKRWAPNVIYADESYVLVEAASGAGALEVVVSRVAGGNDGMRVMQNESDTDGE